MLFSSLWLSCAFTYLDAELFFHERDGLVFVECVSAWDFALSKFALLDAVAWFFEGDADLESEHADFWIVSDTWDVDMFCDTETDVAEVVEVSWFERVLFGFEESFEDGGCLFFAQGYFAADGESWSESPAWDAFLGDCFDWLNAGDAFEDDDAFFELVLVFACAYVERHFLYPWLLHDVHSVIADLFLPTT